MEKKKLVIVEDEEAIRDIVRYVLDPAQFELEEIPDGSQAISIITSLQPDLIVLDWMLPYFSGIDILRFLKKDEQTREIPVIMLTAKTEESDKIRGLDVGADDYITKPFSPKELLARINAVLRRSSSYDDEKPLEMKGLRLEPATHRVYSNQQLLTMGPTEFKLLHFFMTHPERVYSRSQLLDRIWGNQVYVEERTVDVHIGRLRKVLSTSEHRKLIQTVRGSGYRFSTRI